MKAGHILAISLLMFVVVACGDDDDEANDVVTTNLCGQPTQVFDEALLAKGERPCMGDTLVLGLPGNTDATAEAKHVDFNVEIPRAGSVRICLDLGDQPHQLTIRDASGSEHTIDAQGCAELQVAAGVHSVRITNGRPAAAGAKGHLLFIHPANEAGGGASTSGLLGDIIASSDCPGCDLHGVNWSGMFMECDDAAVCGGQSQPGDPFSCITIRKGDANVYYNGSNFSNANFAGANFNGATAECVNFRGAQFYDSAHGPATMQMARDFEAKLVPTTLDTNDFTGASFRMLDLRQANFTCFYFGQLEDYVYSPATMKGVDLRDANLSGVSLAPGKCIVYSGPYYPLDLTGAVFNAGTNVSGTDFGSTNLSQVDMRQWSWANASFRSVSLYGGGTAPTIFHGTIFDGIDFSKAPYDKIFVSGGNTNGILAGADLTGASFVGATLTNAVIEHTIFRANFTKANLTSATFVQKDLRGTNFTYADLQTAKMPSVFLGVSDEQYTQDPTLAANLSFAYMPGADLDHADLRHANLSAVHLYGTPATVSGALMGNANFGGAILSGLDLKAAQLQNVNFQGAQLVSCPFNNANVSNANFQTAHLEGADFTGATMSAAQLTNAALARRGDYGSYTNQVLVYNGTQWTCQPTSTQKWCGKPTGTWSYTEQNGIPYTITFTETVLNVTPTTTCPNAITIGGCNTVDQLTPITPPYPPVPDCVPSATNWCTANPGTPK